MSDWKKQLADVDDDYLIGISNKGIVKRAYKDMEGMAVKISGIGEEGIVQVGEETVTVRLPLSVSGCTCPSRSVCRHVVQAILALKKHYSTAGQAPEAGEALPLGSRAPEAGEALPLDSKASEAGEALPLGSRTPEAGEAPQADASAKVREEICAYPLAALKKAIGNRRLQVLVNQAMSGITPDISCTSIITVALPAKEEESRMVVKLLSPLAYSACTCCKKELCAHKAAAMLWCRLAWRTLTPEELSEGLEEERPYDMENVKEAAGQMKVCLEELFGIGLSRTSKDASDDLERLAIISHNAGLARLEGQFRALFDSYGKYFKRQASFQAEELMGQMARLYRRADLLQKAKDSAEVARYAGEFKADYVPAGSLSFIGIAIEHFESQAGYEGETVYFLEKHTKKWYTFTNARPIFYEMGKWRRAAEKVQAPWGIGVSLEDLVGTEIQLTGAKCDGRRRLSSSQETKGELIGKHRLLPSELAGWYYDDFCRLFAEQILGSSKEWLAEEGVPEDIRLVFVQPASCEKAEFLKTKQQLSLTLYDKAGKELVIEAAYSKEEAGTIRYLERISEKALPCFIGKVYLRDARIRMRPVAVWEAGQSL